MLRIVTNLVVIACIFVLAAATYHSNWWVAGIATGVCLLAIHLFGDRQTHIFDTPATDTPLWRRFVASAAALSGAVYVLLAAIAAVFSFWFQIHFDVPREDQGWMFFLVWFPALIVLLHVIALLDALFGRP